MINARSIADISEVIIAVVNHELEPLYVSEIGSIGCTVKTVER